MPLGELDRILVLRTAMLIGTAGLAMVAIGTPIIARSSFVFERTRRAIDRDEVI